MRALWSADFLIGCSIRATDGASGEAEDFCFDCRTNKLTYLIIELDPISLRKVAVTVDLVKKPAREPSSLDIGLSRSQIRESPTKSEILSAIQCDGGDRDSSYDMSFYLGAEGIMWDQDLLENSVYDPQLRLLTVKKLAGFTVRNLIGDQIGRISDFILDANLRSVPYMSIRTDEERTVFLAPDTIGSIDLRNSVLVLNIPWKSYNGKKISSVCALEIPRSCDTCSLYRPLNPPPKPGT